MERFAALHSSFRIRHCFLRASVFQFDIGIAAGDSRRRTPTENGILKTNAKTPRIAPPSRISFKESDVNSRPTWFAILMLLAGSNFCLAAEPPVADAPAAEKSATEKPASDAPAAKTPADGPLLKYVQKEDKSYKWVKRREGELPGAKYVELTLTSQTWRDVVWRHQLFIVRPDSVPDDAKHALRTPCSSLPAETGKTRSPAQSATATNFPSKRRPSRCSRRSSKRPSRS
jgi:hypothetical protein